MTNAVGKVIVSGCLQGTSREKLYEELGWESWSDRRWAHRLTIFYKMNNGHAPSYLSDHIPKRNEINFNLRNRNDNNPLLRTQRYKNCFFPYTIKSWKDLNEEVQSFKRYLNDFIRPPGHSLFGIRYKFGIKLLTKIRVSFSDLRDHRFNHNFNCESPICSCGIDDETSLHLFLRCPHRMMNQNEHVKAGGGCRKSSKGTLYYYYQVLCNSRKKRHYKKDLLII